MFVIGLDLLFFIILLVAVAYESLFFPFLIMGVFVGTAFLLANSSFMSVFHMCIDNPIILLEFIALYVLCGIIWSSIKWYIFLKDLRKVVKNIQSTEYNGNMTFDERFYSKTNEHFPPLATKHKTQLVIWLMWWWVSIPTTVCGDWVTRFFIKVYDLLGKFYQNISNHVFSDINTK